MTQFALALEANTGSTGAETVRRLLAGSSTRYMIDHFHVREVDGRIVVTLFVIAPSEVEAMVIGRLVNADLVVSLSDEQSNC